MTESYTNSIQVIDIVQGTTVDGPGFRTAIYCAGCAHQCPGCHNPHTWDVKQGTPRTIDELMSIIVEADMNVTFSGGDPMFRPQGFIELAKRIHAETDKNIWCYTGYTFEQIMRDPLRRQLLEQVDVLVDGRFQQSECDISLLFRGSRNQRLIDTRRSLIAQQAELYDPVFL